MANMVSSPYGPIPGCPNNPRCEHASLAHDVWDEHDPLPQCGFYDDNGDCPCGRPPAGYRRVLDQRVWRKGDLVPAGVHVLGTSGALVLDHGADWTNTDYAWLIEIEQDDTAEAATAEPAGNGCPRGCMDPDGEDCKASLISPCPQGRYQEDASGQFNHACGHLRSSTCAGCGVCKACDACYCGEE